MHLHVWAPWMQLQVDSRGVNKATHPTKNWQISEVGETRACLASKSHCLERAKGQASSESSGTGDELFKPTHTPQITA